jgi:hypothetical protein
MNITYTIKPFDMDEEFATVIYKDDLQQTYEKQVRIPKNLDNSINQDLFDEILNSQLDGMKEKYICGSIKFDKSENNIE